MPPMKPNFDCKNLRQTVLDMAFAGSTVHIGNESSIIQKIDAFIN
jgi:hypothetical protein